MKRIKTLRRSVSVEVGSVTIVTVVVIWCGRVYWMPEVADAMVAGGIALLILTLVQGLIVMALRVTHFKDSLRETLRELAAVRCTERNRTARELHDSVCQLLAAARHSLELAAERRSVPDEFETLFARGLQQLSDAICETRLVSHDLKSGLLSEHCFPEALESLGREFAERTRVRCDLKPVDAAVDEALTTRAKQALLRITQEALANVQKHSGASHVELALEHNASHVELRVADNGRGLSHWAAGGSALTGIGISNMRERTAALGGTLSVLSSGSRTEVIARLPAARRDATRHGSLAKVTVP